MEVWLSHDFIAMATAARRRPAGCAAGSAARDGPRTEGRVQVQGSTRSPLVLKGSFPHTQFRSDPRLS